MTVLIADDFKEHRSLMRWGGLTVARRTREDEALSALYIKYQYLLFLSFC
jgi:hypothetical protein